MYHFPPLIYVMFIVAVSKHKEFLFSMPLVTIYQICFWITCLIEDGGGEGQRWRRKQSKFSVNNKCGLPSPGCGK